MKRTPSFLKAVGTMKLKTLRPAKVNTMIHLFKEMPNVTDEQLIYADEAGLEGFVELLKHEHAKIRALAETTLTHLEEEDKEIIMKDGGLKNVKEMISYKDIEVQRKAMWSLAALSAASERNHINIINDITWKSIVSRSNADDNEIRSAATCLIANLCLNEEMHDYIMKHGGLEVLKAKAKSDDIELQRAACNGFANLTIVDENVDGVVANGGLETILSFLSSSNTEVLTAALHALANIVRTKPAVGNQIVNSDTLPKIVELMTHSNGMVRLGATALVTELLEDQSNHKALMDANLFKQLCALAVRPNAAQMQFLLATSINSLALNPEYEEHVKTNAFRALKELSRSHDKSVKQLAIQTLSALGLKSNLRSTKQRKEIEAAALESAAEEKKLQQQRELEQRQRVQEQEEEIRIANEKKLTLQREQEQRQRAIEQEEEIRIANEKKLTLQREQEQRQRLIEQEEEIRVQQEKIQLEQQRQLEERKRIEQEEEMRIVREKEQQRRIAEERRIQQEQQQEEARIIEEQAKLKKIEEEKRVQREKEEEARIIKEKLEQQQRIEEEKRIQREKEEEARIIQEKLEQQQRIEEEKRIQREKEEEQRQLQQQQEEEEKEERIRLEKARAAYELQLQLKIEEEKRKYEEDAKWRASLLMEMNKARTNPIGYANELKELRKDYDGNDFYLTKTRIIETYEGIDALEQAIKTLEEKTEATHPFTISQGMSLSCQDLCDEIGPTGAARGSSDLAERWSRYGYWSGKMIELTCYRLDDPKIIVQQWIIDDGDNERYDQQCILNPNFSIVGFAFKEHKTKKKIVVVEFASKFDDDPDAITKRAARTASSVETENDSYYIYRANNVARDSIKLIATGSMLKVTSSSELSNSSNTTVTTTTLNLAWQIPTTFDPSELIVQFENDCLTVQVPKKSTSNNCLSFNESTTINIP